MLDSDLGAEHRDDNDTLKGGVAILITWAVLASVVLKLEANIKKNDETKDDIPTTGVEEITKDDLIPSESALTELITTIPQTTKAVELKSVLTDEQVEKIRDDLNEMFALTGLDNVHKPLLDYYEDRGLGLYSYSYLKDENEADKLTKFIVVFCQKYNITNIGLMDKTANILPKECAESLKVLSVHKTTGNDIVNLENFSNLIKFTSFGVHFSNLTSCTNLKEFSLSNYDGYEVFYEFYNELNQLEDLSFIVGELDHISIRDISINVKLPASKMISITINQSFNQNINLTETDNLMLHFDTYGTPKITVTGKVNDMISCQGDGSLNLEYLEGNPKLYDENGEVSYKKEQAYILIRKND